jgi:hypothetical protein
MRHAMLGLALAVLGGCGSGGGGGRAESPYIIVSVTLPADHPNAAVTTWGSGSVSPGVTCDRA